jgi:hypothetical protein
LLFDPLAETDAIAEWIDHAGLNHPPRHRFEAWLHLGIATMIPIDHEAKKPLVKFIRLDDVEDAQHGDNRIKADLLIGPSSGDRAQRLWTFIGSTNG